MHVTDIYRSPAGQSATTRTDGKSRNTERHDGKEGVVGSNPTEGFPSQRGLRVLEPVTDDPQPSTSPASDARATQLLQHAIDSYRAGSDTIAERALSDAWRLCLPAVQSTIAGRIREHDRRDDAEQGAFLKVWTAVRGYDHKRGPVRSAEAFFRWGANFAALNVVEKRDRIAGREYGALDDETTRDIIEYRTSQIGGDGLDETKAMADFARYAAARAGSPERGKLWAAIIFAVAEGVGGDEGRRGDISEYVSEVVGRHVPEVSIRREVWHMVRELDKRAMDHLEVIIDWRTSDLPEDDCGQSALFAFDWQEIS